MIGICKPLGFCKKGRMRRITIIEPLSRFAIWSRRMALLSLASTALALYLTRSRLVEPDAGMAAILAGLVIAVIALCLALAAFSRIWYLGRRGLGSAVTGFLLALVLLALPLYVAGLRLYAPQPRDISTDPQRPPAFSAPEEALPLRPGLLAHLIPEAPMTQTWRARAMVQPLHLEAPPREAEELARRAARALDLHLADERARASDNTTALETALSRQPADPPPLPPLRPDFTDSPGSTAAGGDEADDTRPITMEASGETPILRLPLRLSVRITPVGDRVRIDARVTAPQGNYDIGANSALLRAYLAEIAFLDNPR